MNKKNRPQMSEAYQKQIQKMIMKHPEAIAGFLPWLLNILCGG